MTSLESDVLLAGGGLANGLIALRLSQLRPDLRVTLVEREERLGGNHLWSFHDTDLSAAQREWVAPLVVARWRRHEVRFPARRRTLRGGYNSLDSQRFDAVLRSALKDTRSAATGHRAVVTGVEVTEVTPRSLTLANGRRLEAPLVIDGRGARPTRTLDLAWQKFVGHHVELEEGHGVDTPVLMDATVEQRDGYRFVYVLPLDERSLLIEDTYYADEPDLDRERLRAAIGSYAAAAGWTVRAVAREEHGVLPIVLGGDAAAYWRERPAGVPQAGLGALLFHPTTGYSLPEAVRLADAIASIERPRSEQVDEIVRRRSLANWSRHGYFRLLNRMLFRAARAGDRYKVLQRFYGLGEPLIERFYAGKPTLLDRCRVLVGRPPVPLGAALGCLFDRSNRTTGGTSHEIP